MPEDLESLHPPPDRALAARPDGPGHLRQLFPIHLHSHTALVCWHAAAYEKMSMFVQCILDRPLNTARQAPWQSCERPANDEFRFFAFLLAERSCNLQKGRGAHQAADTGLAKP